MTYFVVGIIFTLVIFPVLDSFTSLILSFFEMIKSYLAIVITRNNDRMREEPPTHALGFSLPEEDEGETKYDDDL